MSFPAITPVQSSWSTSSFESDPDAGSESFGSGDPSSASTTSNASSGSLSAAGSSDPLLVQYYTLRRQETELQAEVNTLERQLEEEMTNANVSWTLSQTFRAQEDAEKDDARENGEDSSSVSMSGVMSTNSRSYREDARDTAALLEQKKTDLSSVQNQMAQVRSEIDKQPKAA